MGLFRVAQTVAQSSRKSLIASCSSRQFHSSSPARARRASPTSAANENTPKKGRLEAPVGVDQLPLSDVEEHLEEQFDDDDIPSSAHDMLREQRQVLNYMRLIEHEMPKLVGQ